MPSPSVLGCGRLSTTTAAAAASAQARSTRRRDRASATESGPRNSSVTARPRPSRSTAQYRDTFIVANTAPSASTGHHCDHVNIRSRGRPAPTSTAAAIHCRTATTPTGPITGKASAPTAAPTWVDSALPVIIATPVRRTTVILRTRCASA